MTHEVWSLLASCLCLSACGFSTSGTGLSDTDPTAGAAGQTSADGAGGVAGSSGGGTAGSLGVGGKAGSGGVAEAGAAGVAGSGAGGVGGAGAGGAGAGGAGAGGAGAGGAGAGGAGTGGAGAGGAGAGGAGAGGAKAGGAGAGGAGVGGAGGAGSGGAGAGGSAPLGAWTTGCVVRDLSSWITRYDAKVMGTTATLTPDKANKKGSVWLAFPAGFSSFEVAFDLRVAGMGPDADGLTLSWIVPGGGDPAPDASGTTLNLPTRPGYAVAFDTFPSPTVLLLDGSATNLADNTSVLAKTLASAPLAITHDWQPVVVRFELGKITAVWSGGAPLSAQLTGATLSTTYLGFTAATGGADSEQSVRAVRIGLPGGCL